MKKGKGSGLDEKREKRSCDLIQCTLVISLHSAPIFGEFVVLYVTPAGVLNLFRYCSTHFSERRAPTNLALCGLDSESEWNGKYERE